MKLINKFKKVESSRFLWKDYAWPAVFVASTMIFNGGVANAEPLKAQKGASAVVAPAEVDEKAFVEFQEWLKNYEAAATPAEKSALEARGLELAKARREVMFQFIVFDPQRALEYAIPLQTRLLLPAAIVAELEVPLSGRSEFAVLAAMYTDKETGKTQTRIRRSVVLAGTAYHASVYGARLGVTSKNRIAWHGIALKDYIALDESPFRRIEEGEILAPDAEIGNEKQCPVCEEDAAKGIAVDVGGVIYFFDTEEHLKKMEAKVKKREGVIDPDVNGLELLESLALKRNPQNVEHDHDTEDEQD